MLVADLMLNYTSEAFGIASLDICISKQGKHGLNETDI